MLDLETLGSRPGCAILSIGAIAFDPNTMALGPTFYTVVNRSSCRQAGLLEDRATIAWWNRQSPQSREVLSEVDSLSAPHLGDALEMFASFMRQFSGQTRVWGCGADFDNAILAHIYAGTGRPLPWRYTNNRCYRTLKNLVKQVPMQRSGTHHNALDDARSQAGHALEMLSLLSKVYTQ